jgi:hypothetical protein
MNASLSHVWSKNFLEITSPVARNARNSHLNKEFPGGVLKKKTCLKLTSWNTLLNDKMHRAHLWAKIL